MGCKRLTLTFLCGNTELSICASRSCIMKKHMKVDAYAHTRSQFLRIRLAIREAEMSVVK